jgi:putative ATP-dependent endonuclease of the OLD family
MHLSRIRIENYKALKDLTVDFARDINVIVGENGCGKTALIDAIRLLYNLGEQQKSIYVNPEDFFLGSDTITISYHFADLTLEQKGAFYQYLVLGASEQDDSARITLRFRLENDRVLFSYFTGEIEGQKADPESFRLFVHHYLGALRDSTRDLLSNRSSILAKLLQRLVARNQSAASFESLVQSANSQLLGLTEVKKAESSINANLKRIFGSSVDNLIGLQVADPTVETILGIIKPYLPHDRSTLQGDGFTLRQNSLGFNNLIYAATILGDINERQQDDPVSHNCLLIEEPEAHLHPQLQQSLFAFLRDTNAKENSQLFVTTHSPTLTSRVPLSNLIKMSRSGPAVNVHKCFDDSLPATVVSDDDVPYTDPPEFRKRQLERYLDVTRSQLFFGRGILFVEGISEELLVPAFALLLGFTFEDYRIEMVNVEGTSFYPFLSLFDGNDPAKRLSTPVSIITDDDRFPDSRDSQYSFKHLLASRSLALDLHSSIVNASPTSRISNIEAFITSSNLTICLQRAAKTFEYDIVRENIGLSKSALVQSPLFSFLTGYPPTEKKMAAITSVLDGIEEDALSTEDRAYLTLLVWKSLPSKASFAQDLSAHITQNHSSIANNLVVPNYIKEAIVHLTGLIAE